ncbi:MAG: AmmeMemoRadiSam system radical SAM enzyme [Nitrospirae bacterium]|nr:AmmeMemoRadiSam system radical SAM enzyme [Nitrospirota bacterium]
MREAMFYEMEANQRVRCTLCPHFCKVAPGHRGACGVRINRDGTLYTLVADRVVSQEVDPIEKKPLFHFLPGSEAYSIATVGCNLRCLFCQNWEISQGPKGRAAEPVDFACPVTSDHSADWMAGSPVMPDTIVAEAKARRCASVAYTYTEPTIFFELALDSAKAAQAAGLKNVFVTNGFIASEPLRMIAPYLDAANIDLKAFRESFYKRVCGAPLQPILDAIRLYKQLGIWIEITTLVIPGRNDEEAELRDLARFIVSDLGEEVPWHISRFFPAYKMGNTPITPIETLRLAKRIGLEAGLRHVYLGNVFEEGVEDTDCPACHTVLIRRVGLRLVENRLQDGACPTCRRPLAGVWQ